jgi:actin-like ATPase involved in cell morphogenesis
MEDAADIHREATGQLLESMQSNQKELNSVIRQGIEDTADDVEHIATQFGEHVKHSTDQLEKASEAQQRAVSELLETLKTNQQEMNGTVEQMVEQTSENIANQIEALDEELGDELIKALRSLGDQLASLSEKFVSDYTPLTRELQRLVESSKRTNGGRTS